MAAPNFGIPQISKYVDNTALFDKNEEAAKKYAEKVSSGKYENVVGVSMEKYTAQMAKVKSF